MRKLRQILMATGLTLSLATASFGGTILGSRTSGSRTGTIIGSRTGTIIGSRTGTIIGSRTGTIIGSRTGTIIGSRTGTILGSGAGVTGAEYRQTGLAVSEDYLLSRIVLVVLGWSF